MEINHQTLSFHYITVLIFSINQFLFTLFVLSHTDKQFLHIRAAFSLSHTFALSNGVLVPLLK